jgi:hypothetical protein
MIQSTAVTNTHTRTSLNSSKSKQYYILLYNNSKISKTEINSSLRIIIFKSCFHRRKKNEKKRNACFHLF